MHISAPLTIHLLLIFGAVCCGQDWTTDIETLDATSLVVTDLLINGVSQDREEGPETILFPWITEYTTVVSEATSVIDSDNVSQAEVTTSSGVETSILGVRAYATANYKHHGVTDLLDCAAVAEGYTSAVADAYLHPTHGGTCSGQIVFDMSSAGLHGIEYLPWDMPSDFRLRAIAGNTVVVWTYDRWVDKWQRTGLKNQVVNGENVSVPLPPDVTYGFLNLHDSIDVAERLDDEYDELQIYSGVNDQPGEDSFMSTNEMRGSYSLYLHKATVTVKISPDVEP
jgi:hypothetical protein